MCAICAYEGKAEFKRYLPISKINYHKIIFHFILDTLHILRNNREEIRFPVLGNNVSDIM